ncbi:MAG: hypothetical protein AABY22_33480 [Nanoarchaeota archaeon]
MYTVICDNCGVDAGDNSTYSAWRDESQARNSAVEAVWGTFKDEKNEEQHMCPKCYRFDDDDKIIINQTRTKAVAPKVSKTN